MDTSSEITMDALSENLVEASTSQEARIEHPVYSECNCPQCKKVVVDTCDCEYCETQMTKDGMFKGMHSKKKNNDAETRDLLTKTLDSFVTMLDSFVDNDDLDEASTLVTPKISSMDSDRVSTISDSKPISQEDATSTTGTFNVNIEEDNNKFNTEAEVLGGIVVDEEILGGVIESASQQGGTTEPQHVDSLVPGSTDVLGPGSELSATLENCKNKVKQLLGDFQGDVEVTDLCQKLTGVIDKLLNKTELNTNFGNSGTYEIHGNSNVVRNSTNINIGFNINVTSN
ncbi:hypothetical protein [Carp edema virus]|nr:hypothetical protein [Carp edema virus]